MTFIAPVWLLGLIPWVAVTIWLLIGRGQSQKVPFIQLWQMPAQIRQSTRRQFHFPPWGVALAILSILSAIFAAAQPRVRFMMHAVGPKITIILDRGLSMTARGKELPRWKELLEQSRQPLLDQFGDGPVDLVLLPEFKTIETDRANWSSIALQSEPAPIDTCQLVATAATRALQQTGCSVIVISDKLIDATDPRVIQISPPGSPQNVGIVAVSAQSSPRPQVMVTLRNDSSLSTATLTVAGISQSIALPGTIQNYFVDLPDISESIAIELAAPDDLPIDNHAKLIRQSSWPTIEPHGQLPSAVLRMIDAYAKRRPATESSPHVQVTPDLPPASSQPAIILADAKAAVDSQAQVHVENHPISANLDWATITKQNLRIASPAPKDWQPIVTAGGQPLIAVRSAPVRQAWIGFWSDDLSRSSDFVVLWTNLFNWTGAGREEYRMEGVAAIPLPPSVQSNWQSKLRALTASTRAGADLTALFVFGALCLIFAATLVWATCKNCAVG